MFGLLAQEFKTLFKSPSSISILIIPLVLLVGLGYLLPSGWIVPSSITIGIVGAVLLYFGGSIEEIKRTSFMKSVSLTRLSKFSFLATKILFSIFVSMIAVIWVLFFSWVFTSVDAVAFLATDFSNLLPEGEGITDVIRVIPFNIKWDKVEWITMLYAGMITIIVAVSISFVFVAFAKSSLSFYLMSFGYLLAMILFGGVVMPSFLISADNSWFKSLYYLVPNFYTNNVMAASFGSGLGESVHGLTDKLSQIIGNESILNASQGAIDNINAFFALPNWQDNLSSFDDFLTAVNTTGAAISDSDMAYYEWVYEFASTGGEIFANLIAGISEPVANVIGNIAGGAIGKLQWDPLWAILKPILKDAGLGPAQLGTINTIAKPIWNGGLNVTVGNAVNGALTDHLGPVIVGISDPLGNAISDAIVPALTTNADLNTTVNGLLTTIDGMFNTDSWYDYLVPWLETGVFLGIAVTFFRWS